MNVLRGLVEIFSEAGQNSEHGASVFWRSKRDLARGMNELWREPITTLA